MSIPIPQADLDPIIRLHDYYFQASDLMHENFMKMWNLQEKKGGLSHNNVVKIQSFLQLWLATLYVVAEGFQDKGIKSFFEKIEFDIGDKDDNDIVVHWNSIQHQIPQIRQELKMYRNSTFHFQDNMDALDRKRESFMRYQGRHESIDWALGLHKEMKLFFQCYRPRAAALQVVRQSESH